MICYLLATSMKYLFFLQDIYKTADRTETTPSIFPTGDVIYEFSNIWLVADKETVQYSHYLADALAPFVQCKHHLS